MEVVSYYSLSLVLRIELWVARVLVLFCVEDFRFVRFFFFLTTAGSTPRATTHQVKKEICVDFELGIGVF